VELTPAHFSLTIGSGHALDNVCVTFLDEADVVLVESPSFPGSIRAIRSSGCSIVPVPVDGDGLIVEALEERLLRIEAGGRRAKALYTIPSYHNPTGTSLTLERRQRLVELCQSRGVLIIEDNAYGEIGFDEALPLSLFSIARGHGVIKLGTFSKIVATGLRVGWIQGAPAVINATLATRFDMGQSPFLLRTLAEYAAGGRLDAHIDASRKLYRRRRDLMLAELAERCQAFATWKEPAGGFFVWLKLAEGLESLSLRALAETEGVYVSGGPTFFVDPPNEPDADRNIRLAFSYAPEEKIGEGIRRLARAMQAAMSG
jgi:2-aminoadipate transaminase